MRGEKYSYRKVGAIKQLENISAKKKLLIIKSNHDDSEKSTLLKYKYISVEKFFK